MGAKPGQRADDHRSDARFQRGVEDRRKLGAVIDRKIVQLARRLGLGIDPGIVAAHEPENRRHLPCGGKAAEILAGRRRTRVLHPLRRKVIAKSRGDALASEAGQLLSVHILAVRMLAVPTPH